MPVYVVTLEPEESLYNEIKRLKRKAYDLVGNQLYLKDAPHLTLYLGNFEPVSTFKEGFSNVISRLKNPISINIEGWVVFENDAVTQKDTLTCSIDENNIPKLRELQKEIVFYLNNFRKPGLIDRYSKVYDKLDEIPKRNLDLYGYPFVGDIWKPHLSIASFDHQAFLQIWEKLKDRCPIGSYNMHFLKLYELNEDDELKLIEEYEC